MGAVKRTKKTSSKKSPQKWFHIKVHTGWHKSMPAGKRRELVLKSHKRNALSAARAMQALSNVSTDRETKKLAHADALYFYNLHSKNK
jgi:hypothetical protein